MNTKRLAGKQNVTALLLRLGLATIFLYAAISSFVNPQDWVGYLPHFLATQSYANDLLKLFSLYELALAAWLLSGVYVRYAALLCAATLAGIVVSNFHLFAITFRDIALIFAALALATIKEK
ncbi:MAG TPA: DoxX family membrane protein [Nevskiaceae bacterium]|nr:DoxX family membrane protein [Nevskiaceae bacterium]